MVNLGEPHYARLVTFRPKQNLAGFNTRTLQFDCSQNKNLGHDGIDLKLAITPRIIHRTTSIEISRQTNDSFASGKVMTK